MLPHTHGLNVSLLGTNQVGQLWLPKVSSSEKERGFTSGSFEFSELHWRTKTQIVITVEAIIFFQAASYNAFFGFIVALLIISNLSKQVMESSD